MAPRYRCTHPELLEVEALEDEEDGQLDGPGDVGRDVALQQERRFPEHGREAQDVEAWTEGLGKEEGKAG